jgi:Holliday junction resolvasome RuvABC DNA-binding subunit
MIKSSGIEPSSINKLGNANSSSIKDEAMAALMALGFPKAGLEKHINQAMTKSPEINNVEDLIKNVLKQMN